MPPQPSLLAPQLLPCAAQVAGVQPQTLGVPPPPQVCGAVQLPQLSVPPQPSGIEPQSLFCAAQVVGVQLLHTLAVQTFGVTQVPQLSVPPQPLEMAPQFLF
jgi:hypothetical protein